MNSSLGYHNFYGLLTVIKHHFQVSLNNLKIRFLTEIKRHKRKMLATWKLHWTWASWVSLITNLLSLGQEEAFMGILFSSISEPVCALLFDTTRYFGNLIWRADSLEKTLMLGGIGGRRWRGRQRMRWLDGITDSTMDMSRWWTGRPGVLQFMGSQRVGHDWATELNWTEGIGRRRQWHPTPVLWPPDAKCWLMGKD